MFLAVLSLATLAHFFLTYCHSLLCASGAVRLSENVRGLAALRGGQLSLESLSKILLLLRLCPAIVREHTLELQCVRVYSALLLLLRRAAALLVRDEPAWSRSERLACVHFAAVALDRRISGVRRVFEHPLPCAFLK